MYSIYQYGRMVGDRARMDCYSAALHKTIRPGSVVVDLGTGTGIIAMLACKIGADRVYAIDYNDSIFVAKQLARANGYGEKIHFIQADSTEITLPEQCDVLISDLRGVLPLFGLHIPTLVDARDRFLKDAGHLIPLRDTLWAAIAEVPELYSRYTNPWGENSFGFDLGIAHTLHTNSWVKARTHQEQLLSDAKCWLELDYNTIKSPNAHGAISVEIKRPGMGHGITVWFDAIIDEGLTFSNAPNGDELGYSMGFFPWSDPVELNVGDKVELSMDARLIGDDYVWSWNTRILRGKAELAHFKQSTFSGTLLSTEQLRKHSPDYSSSLNKDGEIMAYTLKTIKHGRSIRDIGAQLLDLFPSQFRDEESALSLVKQIFSEFSK